MWQALEGGRHVLNFIHYCLMGVALACVGASLGNNPFVGKPGSQNLHGNARTQPDHLSRQTKCSYEAALTQFRTAEGELQDWVLDAVGLLVWICIAAVTFGLGRFGYTQWCSLQENGRPARSQSKQDLFTL